jgi:hypothetical protein
MTTSLGPDVVEHVIGLTGEFSLRLPAGHVELRGMDGDAVRVRDVDGEPLDDRFQIDRGPNRLDVRVRDGIHLGGLLRGGPRRGSARLAVELPRDASVNIDAASAEITGQGLQGEQRYRSASGSIRLTGIAGTVTVESVSGDVTLEPDGQIRLAARSVSGEIAVRGGSLPSMVLSSTSGDIEVDAVFDGQGPHGIQTVSGDAAVHAHGGIRVEAKTLTGSVTSSAPHRSDSRQRGQHDLVVGDGRVRLTFKSISGDLRITDGSPASGAAVSPAAPEPPAPPDVHETERLAILRDLETGAIDVAEAGERLAALEGESDD